SSIGASIWGATISRNVSGLISRVDPTRPLSRMKRIHLDRSATLDHTDPADATKSVDLTGTTLTESPINACGTATFGLPAIEETSGSVSFMPSGLKMRARTNSSHGIPHARSLTCPPSRDHNVAR